MKKIALLLSGGVDSSIALHLLCQSGEKPDCYYIHIGPDADDSYSCTSDEDVEMCQAVTSRYGCKFEIIDLHKEYWDEVVKYTMHKVSTGYTPNPDVMCNTLIKFGAFYKKVGYIYDYIATGHYARTIELGDTHTFNVLFLSSIYWNPKTKFWIAPAKDPIKDQVDFIANIDTKSVPVEKLLFPIGHLMKEEVRKIAEENHLINAKRKDSQGICFLGKINYNDYIEKYLGKQEGDIIDVDTNNVIGKHQGHWFHTIGQRKGLGLSGGPWFVVGKNAVNNIVYVSTHQDRTKVTSFYLADINWLTCDITKYSSFQNIKFKIRHTPEVYDGRLILNGNQYIVESNVPITAASGQFCILYSDNYSVCYGCGEILNKEINII